MSTIAVRDTTQAMAAPGLWARLAYGALFVVALPLLLALWAGRLDRLLTLPSLGAPLAGVGTAAAGAALLGAGIYALRRYGGGWPMSPFPPRQLVAHGVYRVLADPIYLGAVAL